MRRWPRSAAPVLAGGVVSKAAPSVVQLVLLLLVAREGSIEDVGRLALASAVTFLCGNLAEAGTMTSLSLPQTYFGERHPPLRATRTLRFGAALAGSALYGLLWAAGLGSHELVFLLGLPLPALLGLSFGYGGALNGTGALAGEGVVSVAESALVVGVALALFPEVSPVAAALIALSVGRAAGTLVRAALLHRLPQSRVERVPGALRAQAWLLASTAAIVIQGQADVVVLGFAGAFTLLGIYGPLLRACYSTFLLAEGISLAMYSTEQWRRWRAGAIAIGVAAAAGFLVVAEPLVELVVSQTLQHLGWPVLLLALLIPVRFAGYIVSVDLLRAGRQAVRIPVLVAGTLILVGGAIAGWRTGSLTWLAGFRLGSELVLTAGFLYLAQRSRLPAPGSPPDPSLVRVE